MAMVALAYALSGRPFRKLDKVAERWIAVVVPWPDDRQRIVALPSDGKQTTKKTMQHNPALWAAREAGANFEEDNAAILL